ncbi:hypothetical protein [Phytopseudomonas dryadis]|nr:MULTISPECIES: hypothetical protein [Pseudomonas]
MIYPVNCGGGVFFLNEHALASRGNMLVSLRGGLSISPLDAFEQAVITLLDGAVLRYEIGAGKYRDSIERNCWVNFCEVKRFFENISVGGFGDGYLYGRCGKDSISFVYRYNGSGYLEFSAEFVVILAVEDVIVLGKGGLSKEISLIGLSGEVLAAFEFRLDGVIRAGQKAFRIEDKIFINCSGFTSGGLLHCFSLSEKKLLPPISLDNYMGAVCNAGNDFFYIDGASLRRFNAESPRDSEILAELPPLLVPQAKLNRGQEWLWWDGTCLYVASQLGKAIWSYDLNGNLLYEQRVPDGWRIWDAEKGHAETGQNIVHLSTTAHEWGFAAFLSWLPGEFCNENLMQIEAIEAVEVEQIPGKKGKHGYRMTARDANGEHLARHAMHHFARLANKVAPSTMNGGKVNDKDFDGVLELILEIPQRQALEKIYIDYVIEGCEQMRYPLQSHRAGNKRDPVKIKLFWQAIAGGDTELLYDSEASSE